MSLKVVLGYAMIALNIFTFCEAFSTEDLANYGLMFNGTCPNITASFGTSTDTSVGEFLVRWHQVLIWNFSG